MSEETNPAVQAAEAPADGDVPAELPGHVTVRRPRASQVELEDGRPTHVILRIRGNGGAALEVLLVPGADDHDEQITFLERLAVDVRTARSLLIQHRHAQHPDLTRSTVAQRSGTGRTSPRRSTTT